MAHSLPVVSFESRDLVRSWLEENASTSLGILVRVFKKQSGVVSVSFEDLLEEGLCFGWSESKRLKGDAKSYLQQFTPRRSLGTTSLRNKRLADRLVAEGRMTPVGLAALGRKSK